MKNPRRRITACKATASKLIQAHGMTKEQMRDFVGAALLVRNTWLEWGPTDDGTDTGDSFDAALCHMHKILRQFGL